MSTCVLGVRSGAAAAACPSIPAALRAPGGDTVTIRAGRAQTTMPSVVCAHSPRGGASRRNVDAR
jgi:hypothetical protein